MNTSIVRSRRAVTLAVAFLLAVALLAVPSPAAAGWPDALDARTAGMGLAYVAVTGSPNPVCANPASYGFDAGEVTVLGGGAFSGSVSDDYSGFIALRDIDRGSGAGGLSFTYHRSLQESSSTRALSSSYQVGKAPREWLALGVGVGYSKTGSDESPVVTTEAGLILKLGTLSFGALVSDISSTRLGPADGPRTTFKPSMSIGVALETAGGLTLAADAHNLLSVDGGDSKWYSGGAELWVSGRFALRCGAMVAGESGDMEARYTGGFAFKADKMQIGYAIIAGKGSPTSHCVSASAHF